MRSHPPRAPPPRRRRPPASRGPAGPRTRGSPPWPGPVRSPRGALRPPPGPPSAGSTPVCISVPSLSTAGQIGRVLLPVRSTLRSWTFIFASGSQLFLGGFPVHVDRLDLRAGPWRPSQENEARLDARVEEKAPDFDPSAQFLPAILPHELGQEPLERDAVKRVA